MLSGYSVLRAVVDHAVAGVSVMPHRQTLALHSAAAPGWAMIGRALAPPPVATPPSSTPPAAERTEAWPLRVAAGGPVRAAADAPLYVLEGAVSLSA